MKKEIGRYCFGDMTAHYIEETENGCCGLMLYPTILEKEVSLEGNWRVDSLVQLKLAGDGFPLGFSNGHTMRNSQSVEMLHFVNQTSKENGQTKWVETVLAGNGILIVHKLEAPKGAPYVCIWTRIVNERKEAITLEMLSSFSICGIPCMGKAGGDEPDDRMREMNLYRMRSKWSAEGRLIRESFASLELEPSWQRYGVQSIRYGEVGSMPVRGYFPWAAIEDTRYHYMTGAQLYHNASWQIEAYNRDERSALSGGLADLEFGHWKKTILPGESFQAPKSVLSTCVGDVDDISYRLTMAQKEGRKAVPEIEKNLPVLFNEFCTTWGNPTEENLRRIVGILKGKGITYCVIDAGWYEEWEGDVNKGLGGWKIDKNRFPNGFDTIVKEIRDAGMIPGLWFETECVGQMSECFQKTGWQLARDGFPIQVGVRRFWDMRNPEVITYLTEKVIGLLKRYGFGYLKVDYNDNIGIGCDGAESLGEGLRQNAEASRGFFRKIQEELPELVIENCSSGGHRLEPSMMAITSMSSFSDAHECIQIPVIAANVQRAILPEQSQIWAVLRASDNEKRMYYSIINTFLGRMCLSGDIYDLKEEQWKIVEDGIAYYQKVMPVIRNGMSRRLGNEDISYSHPTGWQAIIRIGEQDAEGQAVVVAHRFYEEEREMEELSGRLCIPLPDGMREWKIADCYCRSLIEAELTVKNGNAFLCLKGMEELEAASVLLNRIGY